MRKSFVRSTYFALANERAVDKGVVACMGAFRGLHTVYQALCFPNTDNLTLNLKIYTTRLTFVDPLTKARRAAAAAQSKLRMRHHLRIRVRSVRCMVTLHNHVRRRLAGTSKH